MGSFQLQKTITLQGNMYKTYATGSCKQEQRIKGEVKFRILMLPQRLF